ncbi:phospholipase D-like domain-containing protein [Robbsia sp. KACC 23696]|uniref:phospholipase D-like domain-containing protein n=1 Tax=Robbsia sp. KACC 23696 TaxID=3149231 RepID=UPI00325B47A6
MPQPSSRSPIDSPGAERRTPPRAEADAASVQGMPAPLSALPLQQHRDGPSRDDEHGPERNARRLRGAWRTWRATRLKFLDCPGATLMSGGTMLFPAMVEAIDAAHDTIRLETYIFCHDEAGQAISAALVRAAQRGVAVQVITDGVGTAALPLIAEWPAQGIVHRIFNPHWFGALGLARDHRKLCVVDQRVAFVGGINIVDDWMNEGRKLDAPRWDFAVALRGPVVRDVTLAFDIQWNRVDPARQQGGLWQRLRAARVSQRDRRQLRRVLKRERALVSASAQVSSPPAGARDDDKRRDAPLRKSQVAFVARDNLLNRRAIERAYLQAIRQARHRVLLATPYFTPGRRLRRALIQAAQRGLDVRLLIGRKEFALLDWAVPSLYGAFLKAGVRIAEYDQAMLHGKVAVVDDAWATVGSSNLDALSLFLNHEANVVLLHDPLAVRLREAIEKAFDASRRIDPARYAARGWMTRALNGAAYLVYRFMMRLLTAGRFD